MLTMEDCKSLPLALGVVGHRGRFGQHIVAAAERRGWNVCWRRDREGIRSSAMPAVLFDCSSVEAAPQSFAMAVAWGIPLVLATSGVSWRDSPQAREAAEQVPVVVATNLSRGHRLQLAIARLLAEQRDEDAKIHIVDRHPATKVDPISGTARVLAAAAGTPRITSVRTGPPVADHQIVLQWAGERLEINHGVTSMQAPAEGAMRLIASAAHLDQPGLYDLESPELDYHLTGSVR